MKNSLPRFSIVYLIFVFSFTSLLNAQESNPKPDKISEGKYTIDNCLNSFSMEKTQKTKVGYQYWFADKAFADGRTVKLSVVNPNSATHPPHVHEGDEFFFILEGTAEFYLNGETRTAGPLASFYCPPGSEHGIKNVGNTVLKYLVIRDY